MSVPATLLLEPTSKRFKVLAAKDPKNTRLFMWWNTNYAVIGTGLLIRLPNRLR